MTISEITKIPEIENGFPKPRNYANIKIDISNRGIQIPLIISTKNELICGYTRYQIAQELGIENIPVSEPIEFASLNEMKCYAIKDNDLRRQMSDLERYEYVIKPLLEMEQEEAEQREKAGVKIEPKTQDASWVGKSVDIVGAQIGWSGDKVQRIKIIAENTIPEAKELFIDNEITQKDALLLAKEAPDIQQQIVEKVHAGKSIKSAINESNDKDIETPPLPEGKFDVIYADPPWKYDNTIRSWGPAELHYPTIPLEDICNYKDKNGMPITGKFTDNAVLFLWVTNPFLQDAFKVVESWGFKYKTNMVWIKRNLKRPGSGFYVRGRHELLFICTKGSFVPDQEGKEPIGSVIDADLNEHSAKPEVVYEIIEAMYPDGKYLELFLRGKPRKGWTGHGYEATT